MLRQFYFATDGKLLVLEKMEDISSPILDCPSVLIEVGALGISFAGAWKSISYQHCK